MPDLRPLLSPDSVAIIGAACDDQSLRGRLTHQLVEHGFPGRLYPVTRSQQGGARAPGLRHGRRFARGARPRGDPRPGGPCHRDDRAMRRRAASGPRSSSAPASPRRRARRRRRATPRCGRSPHVPAWSSRAQFGGVRQSAAPLVATFSPVFHDADAAAAARRGAGRGRSRSAARAGALTFAFLSRGRDRGSCASPIRSAPATRLCSKRTIMSIGCIDAGGADIFLRLSRRHPRPDRFRAVADKAARAGKSR